MAEITKTKRTEKDYHDDFYASMDLPAIDPEVVAREQLQPCFTTGVDWYADNKQAFHELIRRYGGWQGKVVNDYACGLGHWSIYFSLTGAKEVRGFDLSETAIARGRERVARQGLSDKVKLDVMDATDLGYADDTFDMVIGHGVIHHVIKYPGIFEELHRVMKPGTRAFFLEGLADFPVWRLWWKIKGEVPQGDVPIFTKEIHEKAHMFSDIEIHGDTFVYSLKRLLWKKSPGAVRRSLLRASKNADTVLFSLVPALRRWGSFSYIVLTK